MTKHLKQLETSGLAAVWSDRSLALGESWEHRILEEIRAADIVLLLVSPDYLTSTFVRDNELPLIRERQAAGAHVIPVILAEGLWQADRYIGSLQAFGQGKALHAPTTLTFQREAADLVKELHELIASRRQGGEPAEPVTPVGRVDASGLAFKGSQLQTQIYVNTRAEELDAGLRAALPNLENSTIDWRSPLASKSFAEYRDRAFLQAVGYGQLVPALKEFWPAGGPRWDALAAVTVPGQRTGVLLVEGKSYPEEMFGGGAKAEGPSRERILRAMALTQERLGLPPDPESWLSRNYQFANRIAHLVWLRAQGVETWLVQLLFVGDPHRPTDEAEWRSAIASMHSEIGLRDEHLGQVGVVFLPALSRDLLMQRV